MKSTVVAILLSLVVNNNAFATLTCSSIFQEMVEDQQREHKQQKRKWETDDGEAKYFSVHHYDQFKGGRLEKDLNSIPSLTRFSELLSEINSSIPEKDTVPKEAFYIANRIVPLIKEFLQSHDVNFRVETYDVLDVRKTLIIITETGKSNLNNLAEELGSKYGRHLLVIDPIAIFYKHEHYNKSKGQFFDLDVETDAYAMSFRMILHSQRADFSFRDIERTDAELIKQLIDMKIDSITSGPKPEVLAEAQEKQDEKFKKSRQRAAARLNSLIEKATGRKIESKPIEGDSK